MSVSLFSPLPPLSESTQGVLECVRREIRDEYLKSHDFPWIIGFSGGKDSTLLVHLVFELLLDLPPDQRKRPVHIVANDTLVENPHIVTHLRAVMNEMRQAVSAWRLPISFHITRPDPDSTFWVNLIGRGYPTPTHSFRWCTDKLKIRPTSRYIREHVTAFGSVILLIGVRRDESATRAASIKRYDGSRLHPHGDLPGCWVFRPIKELTTEQVWEFLGSTNPPWGGSYRPLIQLYRNALGGECPVVMEKSDVPFCGTASSRFGCWTCTVVKKDKSLEGFVESGFKEVEPLVRFRNWLMEIRDEPGRRLAQRRNGKVTFIGDNLIQGPFTLETRREILERLMDLQDRVKRRLISEEEIAKIKQIWADDAAKL